MIIEKIPVGDIQANCYIVGCEKTKEGIVIDPGGEIDKIEGLIKKLGLSIKIIIITHAHFDHALGARTLKERTGALFIMHKEDIFLLKNLAEQAQFFGVKPASAPDIDRFVEEGDEISFGELKARVLHTPGHSPGGISLLVDDSVFVGDTLFAGSVGRTDFVGGSHEILIESIKLKLLALDPKTEVYPGHGLKTSIEAESSSNPFLENLGGVL